MTEDELLAALHVIGVTRRMSENSSPGYRLHVYEYMYKEECIGWSHIDSATSNEHMFMLLRDRVRVANGTGKETP